MPELQQEAAPSASTGEAPQQQQQNPLIQMITSIDQSITKVSQVVSQASPEHGQALEAVGEQFRQIIGDFIEKQKGGQQRQAPPRQAPSETGGNDAVQQAY